jgi:hypothetical protein
MRAGFFDLDERLKQPSAKGDHLERLSAIVNFEVFRADLDKPVPRSDGSKGGRPPFDRVFMFKVLVLQAYGVHHVTPARVARISGAGRRRKSGMSPGSDGSVCGPAANGAGISVAGSALSTVVLRGGRPGPYAHVTGRTPAAGSIEGR